jgi:NADH:ubiquinone oxidoreductase subunit K
MAVRIPIVTVFDSKGLRQAQFQLNKVRGNFQNLGRNFALAGAAFAGAAAVIVKSARDLARIEKINAQTEAVLKSMGSSAGVTSKHIQDLAGNLEKLTASEAETIQEGANLLLTFRNIQNQVGTNNDIFDQAVKMSVDLSRAMGTTASGEAIRLGKALNDPVKGVSALTRVGVSFTEQQKEQIKTLSQSGDILGAQKIILAELQAQFGGSGQAYAATFAGQVELLNHELGALGEEATLVVMPALQAMVTSLRELAPEIGAKLSAAIASVDWKAFVKTLVDTITFLVQNAETIVKVVAAIYALNTAYNLGRVAIGLYNAAAVIVNASLAAVAAGTTTATIATNIFRVALLALPWVAVAAGVALLIAAFTNTEKWAGKSASGVATFGDELQYAGGKAAVLVKELDKIPKQITTTYTLIRQTAGQVASSFGGSSFDAKQSQFEIDKIIPDVTKAVGSAKDPTGLKAWVANAKKEATITKKETRLINLGLGADVAANLASSGLSVVNDAIKRVTKNGSTAITNLTNRYTKSAAGQAAAASAASAAAESAAAEVAAAAQAAAEAAAREAAILAEKQRVYEAFASSVISTFAGIRDSILGAFSLPELGGSTDSIIRNMDKLLARVKAFSSNITKLSSMGLDPKLLQQVINAGPIAGAKLAANLVSGGIGGLNAINAGYAELGNVAGEIGMTGTQSLFNTAAQQAVYNVTVNGGLDSGPTIGKAVVDAIRAYERTSGPVFQGA